MWSPASTLCKVSETPRFFERAGDLWVKVCGVWAVSPYPRCSFRCVYCNAEAQGDSQPHPRFKERLTAGLSGLAPDAVVGIGVTSDAYPPIERQLGLTRWLIQELTRAGVRFRIITKGTAVLRDLDLLVGNACLSDVCVSVSTHDRELVRSNEPGAPTYEERLDTALALADAGITVSVGVAPWIPGVTDASRIVSDVGGRVRVIFGAIDLGERAAEERRTMGLRAITSARRVYGKQFRQADVNLAYLRAAAAFPRSPDVWWLRPPGTVGADNVFVVMTEDDLPVLLAEAEAEAEARAAWSMSRAQDATG